MIFLKNYTQYNLPKCSDFFLILKTDGRIQNR